MGDLEIIIEEYIRSVSLLTVSAVKSCKFSVCYIQKDINDRNSIVVDFVCRKTPNYSYGVQDIVNTLCNKLKRKKLVHNIRNSYSSYHGCKADIILDRDVQGEMQIDAEDHVGYDEEGILSGSIQISILL